MRSHDPRNPLSLSRRDLVRGALGAVGVAAVGAWPTVAQAQQLSDLPLYALGGNRLHPSVTDGRVVMVVNVASNCHFVDQYASLQTLYDRYAASGLVILGVPSNQFLQEPGTSTEIQSFCSSRYGVTFPLLAKQDVNGPLRSALYEYLVHSQVGGGKDLWWNFEKFLCSRRGDVIARFPTSMDPLDAMIRTAIEVALAQPA
jgi:glutathione peroxidase